MSHSDLLQRQDFHFCTVLGEQITKHSKAVLIHPYVHFFPDVSWLGFLNCLKCPGCFIDLSQVRCHIEFNRDENKSVRDRPIRSHGNLCIFYEVANLANYEFVRFLLNRAYFMSSPIHMNSCKWPTPKPAPKSTHHWGLDKWGRMNSYKLATL